MKKIIIALAAFLMALQGGMPSFLNGEPSWLCPSLAPAPAHAAAARQEVKAQWAKDAVVSHRDVFVADKDEQHTRVLLSTSRGVKDFKVLRLELKDIGEDGKPVFLTEEIHSQPALAPGRPLELVMTFFGTIPAYGISYVDSTGKTRCFSLDMSGMDGSVLLTEF